MKTTKFLDLHDRLCEEGIILWSPFRNDFTNEETGLCLTEFNGKFLDEDPTFQLFIPNEGDRYDYWAAGSKEPGYQEGTYTALRQTIVLLCAAINGEL